MEIKQNRWRSKVLWAAIVAQLLAIGQLTGIWEAIGLNPGLIGDVVAAVLQLLVIIGVINNPTDAKDW
jgi:uncharacterized membrane protein